MSKQTFVIDTNADNFLCGIIKSPRFGFTTRQAFVNDFIKLLIIDDDFRNYVFNRVRGYHNG